MSHRSLFVFVAVCVLAQFVVSACDYSTTCSGLYTDPIICAKIMTAKILCILIKTVPFVSLAMMLVGGLTYLSAAEDKKQRILGKKTAMMGIIGLTSVVALVYVSEYEPFCIKIPDMCEHQTTTTTTPPPTTTNPPAQTTTTNSPGPHQPTTTNPQPHPQATTTIITSTTSSTTTTSLPQLCHLDLSVGGCVGTCASTNNQTSCVLATNNVCTCIDANITSYCRLNITTDECVGSCGQGNRCEKGFAGYCLCSLNGTCHYNRDSQRCEGVCLSGLGCVLNHNISCECLPTNDPCRYDESTSTCVGHCGMGRPCFDIDNPPYCSCFAAPYIYLYPEKASQIDVRLDIKDGEVTVSEPNYGGGWSVWATPEGKINDRYDYLYYEAHAPDAGYDEDIGWVVERDDLKKWFETYLPKMGLKENEIKDFTKFWTPTLKHSRYYKFSPILEKNLDQTISLDINPKPDTIIRVNLVVEPLEKTEKVKEPKIKKKKRDGFTVVEWGITFKGDCGQMKYL